MMRKLWKQVVASVIAGAMVLTSMPVAPATVQAESTADIIVPDSPAYFEDLTSDEIIEEMGMGINLGNTLEGHSNYLPGETLWNSVVTTKSMIKCMHDLGYNTIRIPVTWGKMINEEDYSIDEAWMSRVQDVVDYAIAENMYVMLNIHHDGSTETPGHWLSIDGTEEEFAKVKEKFNCVWKTIAERFKNYDEHLVFESMNEVYQEGYGWTSDVDIINGELERINALNQLFVDVVRATGSNNARRWLSVPTKNTQISTMIQDKFHFEVPTDSVGRVMVAAHNYDGWNPDSMDETVGTTWAYQFKMLKEKYVDQGIPVVIGEYGVLSGTVTMGHCEGISYLLKKNKLIGCLWDVDSKDCLIDRANETTRYKELTDAMMRGYFHYTDASQVVYGAKPEITAFTSFGVSETEVNVTVDEKKKITVSECLPTNSNDVILWKSSNAEVASVYNGLIEGRAVGTATITAYAQSGAVQKEIIVTVNPKTLETPSTGIITDAESFVVEAGSGTFINAAALPEGNQANVSYSSADESVATVSTMGHIVGINVGNTVITVTTSDGFTKDIPVKVTEKQVSATLDSTLAIHILYNNGSYSGTEVGSGMAHATADGKYTVSFDCATDLSQTAKDAGVTELAGFGALYIYDYDVTSGVDRQSTERAGRVTYHSLKVNDIELLTEDTIEYKAVKDGVIDTGNPLNIWDGSIISTGLVEDKKNWRLSFDGIENPTKIEVTFSLRGFTSDEPLPPLETVAPTQEPTKKPQATQTPQATIQPTQMPQQPAPTAPVTPVPTAPVQTPAPQMANQVTSIKAKVKKVVVKKGKSKKVIFTVKTENGEKANAKQVKTSVSKKKVIKVVKTKVEKKKVIVTVKGLKKGEKAILKISSSKKSAKTTIVVK